MIRKDSLVYQITDTNNLIYAWKKAKRFFAMHDVWFYDDLEVQRFEVNLDSEILAIQNDILNGSYKLSPLKPIPFPKKQDEAGIAQSRQTFWISVRDQVVWIAFVNITGPYFEEKMPNWSYGNRLYRSIWYEEELNHKKLKVGSFRHASGHLYRLWKQSYPLYRKHILYTLRRMNNPTYKPNYKDDLEVQDFEDQKSLPDPLKLRYLKDYYWESSSDSIYWASIDLEKFYPNVNLKMIIDAYSEFDKKIKDLLLTLLDFSIDFQGWEGYNRRRLNKALLFEDLGCDQSMCKFNHIPTGLLVGGYLSNIALLSIDREIEIKLNQTKHIAHFRFVDDHIFLAQDFASLKKWLEDYKLILERSSIGTSINIKKTEPKEIGELINNPGVDIEKKAKKASQIDPKFPIPLLTQTLLKLSELANTDFDLLNPEDENIFINELERLLLTDLPDNEIKRNTRITFAASKIALCANKKGIISEELFKITKAESSLSKRVNDLNSKLDQHQKTLQENKRISRSELLMVRSGIAQFKNELKNVKLLVKRTEKDKKNIETSLKIERDIFSNHVFDVLQKAMQEYPDKIRVWAKALEYINDARIEDGFYKVYFMIDDLEEKEAINFLSGLFLKAFVIQIITDLIFKTIRDISDPDNSVKEIESRLLFTQKSLNGILLNSIHKLYKSSNPEFINIKIELFKLSLIVLKLTLEEIHKKHERLDWIIMQLIEKLSKNKLSNLSLKEFIQSSKYESNERDILWYCITKSTIYGKSIPSKIYGQLINKTAHSDYPSMELFLLFPNNIPKELISSIFKFDKYIALRQNHSFLLEILRDVEEIHQFQSLPLEVVKTMDNKYSLYDWVDLLKVLCEKNPYDVRLTEWFSLSLILCIIESYSLINQNFRGNKMPHPKSIILPTQIFADEFSTNKTWSDFKDYFQNFGDKGDKIDFIYDGVYLEETLFSRNEDLPLSKYNIVRYFGVLLLSICTRSYQIPVTWKIPRLAELYENAILYQLSQNPLSTWTSAIIYACLSARSKESNWQLVLNLKPESNDDDKSFEQLFINTKDDLINEIKQALRILEKYQLSIYNLEPRQLIPINITSMQRNDFNKLKSSY